MSKKINKSLSIIGGAGHVGFPLGLAFASKNYDVCLIDKNFESLKKYNERKNSFFMESGAKNLLKKTLKKKKN